MARDPATKAQVAAHRFMLRRIESSLVRQDPVMLHEPARTHLRSVLVGVMIAALGVGAFFVVGLFAGDDDLDDSDIVVGKDSGAMYVVEHRDEGLRLIPVPNLASARLLVAGLGPGGGVADVDLVEDSSLRDAPRGPLTGIEGAPGYLPGPNRQVPARWGLCEQAGPSPSVPGTTAALIGPERPGTALSADQALLVADVTGRAYLVRDGRRFPVDLRDPLVTSTFELGAHRPHVVGTNWLNAIPLGEGIAVPPIVGLGTPSTLPGLTGFRVGDVVSLNLGEEKYYLVLADGVEELGPLARELVVLAYDKPPRRSGTDFVPAESSVDLSHLPTTPPDVVDPAVACLTWQLADGRPSTAITVADVVPVPDGAALVRLPRADGVGPALDDAFLPPAEGALVRSVAAGQSVDSGQLFLVTDQGIRYAVPNSDVAKVLGLGTKPKPAPSEILRLLPEGPALDPAGALRIYDLAAGPR